MLKKKSTHFFNGRTKNPKTIFSKLFYDGEVPIPIKLEGGLGVKAFFGGFPYPPSF